MDHEVSKRVATFQWSKSKVATSTYPWYGILVICLVSVIEIQSSYFNLSLNSFYISYTVSVIEIQSSYFNQSWSQWKLNLLLFQWSKSKVATSTNCNCRQLRVYKFQWSKSKVATSTINSRSKCNCRKFQWSKSKVATSTAIRIALDGIDDVSVIEIQSSYFNCLNATVTLVLISFQWSKSKVATSTSFSITSIVFKPFVRSHKSLHRPAHDYSCKNDCAF